MTIYLAVTGFFKFACETCAAASACVFGCGRSPKTLCEACYGKTTPEGYLPIVSVVDEPEFVCDECEELF